MEELFEELKAALTERGVEFSVEEGAWCPTLTIVTASGGITTVEVTDVGTGRGSEISISNDGGWPGTFRTAGFAAGTLAMIACC